MARVGVPANTPVPVVTVKVVAPVMAVMNSLAGSFTPPSLTGMPTYMPAVLATVTMFELAVVVAARLATAPAAEASGAPMVIGAVIALVPTVGAADRTNVVPLVTLAIVAPKGMPSPLTDWPGARPAVLATVTAVLALVRVAP